MVGHSVISRSYDQYIGKLAQLSPLAMTNEFDAIRNYKKVLHKIIWWGLSWLTLVLIVIHYLK